MAVSDTKSEIPTQVHSQSTLDETDFGSNDSLEHLISIPPQSTAPDRGFAWIVLLAGFINEGVSWGFAVSYGVFQDYYTNTNQQFKGDWRLAMVGVVSTAMLYLGTPAMTPITIKFFAWRRTLMATGLVIQAGALIAASFAKSVPALIVTQGLLFGVGFVILYMPLISYLNEWFDKRRGLAYGVISASTGIIGIPLPLLLEKILNTCGAATTLRTYAVALFIFCGPTLLLVKARPGAVKPKAEFALIQPYSVLLRRKEFGLYCLSSFWQGLGAYFPPLFLPQFCTDLGLPHVIGATTIMMYCTGQAVGQITFGNLSDRFPSPNKWIVLSSLPTGIFTFLLWGFGKSAAPLTIYALLFGLLAPAYTILFARMGTAMSDDPTTLLASYSMFMSLKGVGNALEGPFSQLLVKGPVIKSDYGIGAYSKMVCVTGLFMILSAVAVLPLVDWHGGMRVVSAFFRTTHIRRTHSEHLI